MRIGVFCSGGDSPGMNACVRSVVRSAVVHGHEVVGIRRGYQGILDEDFYRDGDGILMSPRSVSGILQLGGAILRSSRSDELRTAEGQRKAARNLEKHGIDALVAIGGDGTFRGAMALSQVWDGKLIGCPGTIDNDLLGTEYTLGFKTAVNTAVDAVDKLRDTAESHERMILVEVMGRHSGYIALYTALAGGAEIACLPETPTDVPEMIERLRALKASGKGSIILIVAEGDEAGGAEAIDEALKSAGCPFSTRTIVLGHLQRGGSPVPDDRILGTRLGDFAVRSLLAGEHLKMAGVMRGELVLTPLAETMAEHSRVPDELVRLLETMAI